MLMPCDLAPKQSQITYGSGFKVDKYGKTYAASKDQYTDDNENGLVRI